METLAARGGLPGDGMGTAGTDALGVDGVAVNPAAADWSCLGAPPTATPGITGSGNVRYSVPVRSMFGLPITNFVARVCETPDLSCASPLSEAHGLSAEGLMEVEVPIGFAGFVEMEMDAHVPSVFYMRRPILRDTADLQPILPIPQLGVTQLATLLNLEVVPELGILSVAAVDCRGERAPGVTFDNNLGGKGFYFTDSLPNVTSTSTDIQGQGGFLNVPVRLVEVSAHVEADGRLIGTRTVLPRPGWIAGVSVRPAALPLD